MLRLIKCQLSCLLVFLAVVQGQPAPDITETLQAGGDVILGMATYELDSIEITADTAIIGAGRGQTILRFSGEGVGLLVSNARFRAHNVTFVHDGGAAANVLAFENATVEMADCEVAGAASHDLGDRGVGILAVQSQVTLSDCRLHSNAIGLVATSISDVQLSSVDILDNSDLGMLVMGTSTGVLERSRVRSNTGGGLLVRDDAYVRVLNSDFDQNDFGLLLVANASAAVIEATFRGNTTAGLMVNETSRAWVDYATALEQPIGFWFGGESRSFVNSALAEGNNTGFYVTGYADVTMRDALAVGNHENGMVFAQNALGEVKHSLAEDNGLNGFLVNDAAQVLFFNNNAQYNENSGFLLLAESRSLLETNRATNNTWGVTVGQAANTTLRNNSFTGNLEYGVLVDDSGTPDIIAEGNVYTANGADSNVGLGE